MLIAERIPRAHTKQRPRSIRTSRSLHEHHCFACPGPQKSRPSQVGKAYENQALRIFSPTERAEQGHPGQDCEAGQRVTPGCCCP